MSTEGTARPCHLQRWLVVLLVLGLAWRATRYLLRFPIWGDEAANCLNLVGQDYASITGPLRCQQVAPLLFWWGELTAFRVLGDSEWSLRLLPLLAGVGGLLLFWRLAALTLPPLGRTLAVGFLAVAIWPVSMSTLIKPYAFDLFMASALLVVAVEWLRRPERSGWLAVLVLLAPLTPLVSFPAIFVAGSVSVALLPNVWRQRRISVWGLWAAFNILLGSAFLACYRLSQVQLHPEDNAFNDFLRTYWAPGFPPADLLALPGWLLRAHTGRMLAYPIGGSDGLSALTFLFVLAGLWQLARPLAVTPSPTGGEGERNAPWQWERQRRGPLLVLCLGPFVLGLAAAVIRAYPYAGCCRLSQHVAPILCLLAGAGVATLIERARTDRGRRRGIALACGLLVLVGVGGTVRDAIHPYRAEADAYRREIVRRIIAQSSSDDQIVVLTEECGTDVVYTWELSRFRGHVGWNAVLDADRLGPSARQVWCLDARGDAYQLGVVADTLARQAGAWVLADRIPYTLSPRKKKDDPFRCDVYRWTRGGADHSSLRAPALDRAGVALTME